MHTSPQAQQNNSQASGNPEGQRDIYLDIAIIGGGIAGLWLINRLQTAGYQCALFEAKALGSDQSVASQGMIHGGIKYTLNGALTGASEAIADMPAHWQDCLVGCGDVDLRGANVLSDHFYMWSTASVTSKITTFFASKATRGRVDKVAPADRPALFRQKGFRGQLYKLVDIVLDVPSVLQKLASNAAGRTYLLPTESARWEKDEEGQCLLHISTDSETIRVHAKQFIFTAGKGNADLLHQLGEIAPAMQSRPLQQVMVKFDVPHKFYGHCLGADKTPRLTISSHPCLDGKWVWYLGGSLAENGVKQDADTLIDHADRELKNLMPWLDLSHAQWSTLWVERAEPRQKNLVRPDQAFIERAPHCRNLAVAWPTKLTLSPNLATATLELLNKQGIKPGKVADFSALSSLPQAPVAKSPWDTAIFHARP
ncbi:FAD-dependent oxidoreductase [Aestuariicella hydrocarbonica]|uniref:FAD-dependent oxidoreductase n=1 Tax=Pseudomaricurvus hydrocarbonicus TaxID=1470433 RepID=A0A9E5JXR3_9GAMM|nr:FAD-dependent oxidoreductase [Aestuariicella hydrocarbonica]NHO66536.1 FAD-dependent oxidoreductase [Aestuariicella hydrocarbonica]